MTESEFKNILSRYEKGDISSEEKALIEKWLDSIDFKSENPLTSESEKINIKISLKESIYIKAKIRPDIRKRNYFISSAIKVAASILLLAVIGFGGFKYYEHAESKKYEIIEVISSNEIQKVLLSDGSIIWLKPNSNLKYPANFKKRGERVVTLTGEALFEIEKDTIRPFLVHSGDLTTTVLGTSFNINASCDNIEVVVLTGKVSVISSNNHEGIILLPEEKALYNISNKELAKASKQEIEPLKIEITKGTEYDMKFNDTRMDEIIGRIEGKFDVIIILEDESLSEYIITADFTGQSLTKTLNIISKVLYIDYKIDNNRVILKDK